MIEPSAPIGPLDPAGLGFRVTRVPARRESTADFTVALSRELEGPPPELQAQVRDAGRRWEQLQALGRELRFERDGDSGRIIVQVCDLEGHVLRTVPPSSALEIAAGARLP